MPQWFLESGFSSNDGGWPTTPEYAYEKDGAYAIATTLNDDCIYWTPDLTDLPDNIVIRGIRVRVDGDWHDPGGTDLALGQFSVALTWNGDTGSPTWTGFRPCGILAEDSLRTFYQGGPTDTWGHAWTREELQGAGFRLKIRTSKVMGSPTGAPQWRCDFIQIAVYYDSTSTINWIHLERLGLSDGTATNMLSVHVSEELSLTDSQALGGSAVSDLQSSLASDFNAAAHFQRIEGAVVQLEFGNAGPKLWIGDAAVVTDGADTSTVVRNAQPGLISIDSITYSADFGQEQRPAQAVIRIVNKQYGDAISGTSATLPELLQGKPVLGGKMKVFAMVKGTSWYRRVIFYGSLSSLDINESEITLIANQIGTGGLPVPDMQITDDTFYYSENQYGGIDGREGNKIPEKIGTVIPIGIGRFDVTAVDNSWPAGHLFQVNESTSGSVYQYEKAGRGVVAGMCGIKYPMMPCVVAVTNWTGRHSEMSVSGDIVYGRKTDIFQQVYLHGSRKGSRQLCVSHGDPADPWTYIFGYLNRKLMGNPNPAQNADQGALLIPIYSWAKQDPDYDQACPFVKDTSPRSTNMGQYPVMTMDPLWRWQSAGGMDAAVGSRDWTDGDGNKAFGIFVNLTYTNDSPAILADLKPTMSFALQAVAIPFVKYADPNWVRGDYYGSDPDGVDAEGNGLHYSSSMFNLRDLKSYVSFYKNEGSSKSPQVTYEPRQKSPSLGSMWGIRVGGIHNYTDSVWGIIGMRGRLAGPAYPGVNAPPVSTLMAGWPMVRMGGIENPSTRQEELARLMHECQNTTFVRNGSALDLQAGHYIRPNSSGAYRYFSWWIFAPWIYDRGHGHPEGGWLSDANTPRGDPLGQASQTRPIDIYFLPEYQGPVTPWEFQSLGWIDNANHWDPSTLPGLYLIKWPWNVSFICHQAFPPTDGVAFINKAWVEVIYHSDIGRTSQFNMYAPLTPQSVSAIAPGSWSGYQWWHGKRLPNEIQDQPSTSDLFVSGVGPVKAGGEIIEKGPDVAACLIDHYGAGAIARGSTFGSFDTAISLSSSSRLTTIVNKQSTMAGVLAQVSQQCHAIIDQQLNDAGDLEYRMFVDNWDPSFFDPLREYGYPAPYRFKPTDIFEGEFLAFSSDLTQLSSNIRVRYGWHIPSNTWSGEKFLNRLTNNLSTEADLFQTAALATFTDYGDLENPQVYELPDVWDPAVAEALLKWFFNRQRRRYVTVDFTTYVRHSDLRVGHVISFDNEMDTVMKYPGELGLTDWQFHLFNVLGVSYSKDVDGFLRVKVMAHEVYEYPS